MSAYAVCFAGKMVGSVADLIHCVFAVGSPGKIECPVIRFFSVKVSAFVPFRRNAVECRSDQPMDKGFNRTRWLGQFDNRIAAIVQTLFQHAPLTANAT